jgi:hypothetical protein
MRASSSSTVRGEFAETGALLPHLQAFPQHESEEAHEDVGLDAVGALVPDRANVQLILLDTKSRFGLGELDVGLPQLLITPIGDVRAQEISPLGERRDSRLSSAGAFAPMPSRARPAAGAFAA